MLRDDICEVLPIVLGVADRHDVLDDGEANGACALGGHPSTPLTVRAGERGGRGRGDVMIGFPFLRRKDMVAAMRTNHIMVGNRGGLSGLV
ncbi:hypothetical protein ASG79_13870 [Arthrobacter sp. Soil761]|nr:hypothetical protein ASG79_13870 [Arthrobacter sp. Soil761]